MHFPTVFVAAALLAVACASDPSIVKLDSGAIQGNVTSTYRTFLGVPFAAPPVNELRWQPPQAVKAWEGIRPALQFGASCYQPVGASGVDISEDCLYLNVYAPYPIPAKPVPIMIFIYGGAWAGGTSNVYNAENDITMVEDVIIVTINYRVNVFGFLASQSLRNQGPDGSTGNYGLQDQRFAMQWVQRNGAAFGGDINRVTIFGESAGAGSVSAHLLQPKTWPYFHRAISESGPIADWTAQPYNMSATKFEILAALSNCCESSKCSQADPAVLNCLRQLNSSQLLSAASNVPGGIVTWSPVVDGVEVLDVPLKLLAEGRVANVPVIFGTNRDEGTSFTSCPVKLSPLEYGIFNDLTYGTELGNLITAEYPLWDYSSPYWAASRAWGDAYMSCFALSSAQLIAQAREKLPNPAPVYLYLFNHTLLAVELLDPNKGCTHVTELYLVFDITQFLLLPSEQELAKAFVKYWTSFAASGVPGDGTGLPTWPAFTSNNQVTGVLDVNTLLTPVSGVKADVCTFWGNNPPPKYIIWGKDYPSTTSN